MEWSNNHKWVRAKTLSNIDEVLARINPDRTTASLTLELDGYKVKLSGRRFKMFKLKGVTCVTCGITGIYFAIERKEHIKDGWVLALYGQDHKQREVLMTMDHIVPVSKGGSSSVTNLQPMCQPCNNKKSNS